MAPPVFSAAGGPLCLDPLSAVRPVSGKKRPMIGKSAVNDPVYCPFRPTVLTLANEMAIIADSDGCVPERSIPIPQGWSLDQHTVKNRTQFQLTVDPLYARNKLRRVFGYVAEIQLVSSAEGTVFLDP